MELEIQQYEGHLVQLDVGKDRITLAVERYYVNDKTHGDYLGKPLTTLRCKVSYQRLSAIAKSASERPQKTRWS